MPEDIYHTPKILGAPTRYVLGAGVTRDFKEWVPLLGEKAFLFGGTRSLESCEEDLRESIEESDAEIVEYSSGERFCTDEAADRLTEQGNEAGADFVIGVGGGSIMDLAKFVAHKMGVRVADINVIASTDAPCSALSVIYDEEHVFKRYEFYARNPDLVVMDTEVIANAPAKFLADGMGDASATKSEAEACWEGNSLNCLAEGGLAPNVALSIARLCHDLLMRYGAEALESCEENVVTPQLESIVEANSLLSGLGFESGGLAAAHAIHDGLTAVESVEGSHGELVAFGNLSELVMERRSREKIQEMLEFYDEVGLPMTLEEINVEVDDLDTVAEAATDPEETIHNEPFEVSEELVVNSMIGADKLGRTFKEAI